MLLVALSLIVFGAASGAQPAPVQAAGSLPECRYDDVSTPHASTGDWPITLLDTIYMVSSSYRPPGLVSTSKAGLNKGGYVRRVMLGDLTALARAAREAGNDLRVVSAYRSYRVQRALFNREVRTKGLRAARESVARPGHSEHQLGTTIDFGSANSSKKGWHYSDWAKSPAGAWLKAHGWRYVGREMAADIRASGLTLREYLWRHYH